MDRFSERPCLEREKVEEHRKPASLCRPVQGPVPPTGAHSKSVASGLIDVTDVWWLSVTLTLNGKKIF